MSRQPTAAAGKKLGRYRIQRELGRGGMGVVYVAEDTNTGRQIALKTTAVAGLGGAEKSRNQRRQRFVREVQALTQVNHDNVVHVIDAGEADDPDLGWLLFYSMEYVEGETLAQLVQRIGALNAGAAAAVLTQVAAGLGAAHHSGIVHRDVKPANIFISLDGRALIGDFGICKIEGQTQITRRDQLVGTPNYLAPEQILGDPVSPATDVFALGALFYVITMNRPLRAHVDASSLLSSAQGNEPKERMLSERSVPDGLRNVIARCLEREPKRRWRDGQHLADALADFATRIPALRDETNSDPLGDASSTSDRSSPFASLPSAPTGDVILETSGDQLPFADPSAVAAVADALLAERDLRESASGSHKRQDAPLPVAKTESTVMFNMRAMEEENKKLPVAKTESTVVFKGNRPPDDGHTRPLTFGRDGAPSANRFDETAVVDDDTPAGEALNEQTGEDIPRPQLKVKSFDVDRDARPERAPIKIPMPQLTRPQWIGLAGGAGALLGILMLVALTPASVSAAEPAKNVEVGTKQQRPLLCDESKDSVVVTADDQTRAKELVDQARTMGTEGAQESKRRELIEKALALNPHDPPAYFELGKIMAKDDAAQARLAYQCVCIVASSSEQCVTVKRAKLDQE